ncbi:unnamed protein product [Strongylus vulgaris]|uniref:Innexin n=1 Tax=Strongylus vulgaris TaxID=40348 RepID=A0A3P7LF02_STRVU|nr:unnamed protein product [Strongylus vulgaris]
MNFLSSAVTAIKPRLDDSGIDRLNYYYSTMVIMVLSFTKAWEQYAENYCFVYNTYWVRPDEDVPDSVDTRIAQQLIYYQWVPFIMALEAALFYLPVVFWSQVSNKSGLNIENLVRIALAAEIAEDTDKEKKLNVICSQLEASIELQHSRSEGASFMKHIAKFGQLDGTYVSNVYLMTKISYVINLAGQFFMMNKFLGQNDPYWGVHILSDILTGTDWELSGNFPRIAMCDFQVRVLGNLQRYSIQCVLSLNMFNEKIFLFLYFWFILVGIATAIDTINLAYYTRFAQQRMQFIIKQVTLYEEMMMEDFCLLHINSDVVVILKMIGSHANEVIATEVVQQMWKNFKKRREVKGNNDVAYRGKKSSDHDEMMPLVFA